jgi:hypothetical protein
MGFHLAPHQWLAAHRLVGRAQARQVFTAGRTSMMEPLEMHILGYQVLQMLLLVFVGLHGRRSLVSEYPEMVTDSTVTGRVAAMGCRTAQVQVQATIRQTALGVAVVNLPVRRMVSSTSNSLSRLLPEQFA